MHYYLTVHEVQGELEDQVMKGTHAVSPTCTAPCDKILRHDGEICGKWPNFIVFQIKRKESKGSAQNRYSFYRRGCYPLNRP